MNWLIIGIVSLLLLAVAGLLVSVDARLLNRISSPRRRRLLAIVGCVLIAFIPIALLVLVTSVSGAREDLWEAIWRPYRDFPNLTLLYLIPAFAWFVGLIGLSINGALPAKAESYQPRAAFWSFRSQFKLIGLLFFALLLAIVFQDVELQWRLERMEAQADQIAAVFDLPKVADNENAAKHYQHVADLVKKESTWHDSETFKHVEEVLDAGGPLDDKVREYFKRRRPILDELRRVVACPKCRYDDEYTPLDFLDGSTTNMNVRAAIQMLCQYARLLACEQRSSDTIECIRLARQWETHLQQDPRNSNTLVYDSLEQYIRETIEHLVTHCPKVPSEELKILIADPLPVDAIYEPILKWHAAIAKKTLAETYDGRMFKRPGFQPSPLFASSSLQAKIACHLAIATMRFAWERDDIESVNRRYWFLNEPYDASNWNVSHETHGIPAGYFANRIMDFIFVERIYLTSAEANRRLSNIAISSALYRQECGAWPKSLGELAPKYLSEIPVDPSSGKPFKFKTVGDGFVVLLPKRAEQIQKELDLSTDQSEESWFQKACEVRRSSPTLFIGDDFRQAHSAN